MEGRVRCAGGGRRGSFFLSVVRIRLSRLDLGCRAMVFRRSMDVDEIDEGAWT
jgi:hypothetical protein